MSTPGIADPYWYEWFVGLKHVIRMLNPDNHIISVTFQKESYDAIDDVVVEYSDGLIEECYQVKHEISTSSKNNSTFARLLERKRDADGSNGKSLIDAMASGWYSATSTKKIIPVLFTNRNLGTNTTKRTFNGKKYSAYSLGKF